MPHLETQHLVLRDFAEADWKALNAMLSDPENTRYMHFHSMTEPQRRDWLNGMLANQSDPDRDAENWAITEKGSETLIGWFGIGGASRPTLAGERSFGYLLDRHFWNRGYMTETLRAVLTYEFETRHTSCVSATCETANPASARVMEKVGMQYQRTVEDTDFQGNWAERHHYLITRQEFTESGEGHE